MCRQIHTLLIAVFTLSDMIIDDMLHRWCKTKVKSL